MKRWALVWMLALAACGSVEAGGDDDLPPSMTEPDAGIDGGGMDPRPDARPIEAPSTALDVVPVAGRATGGGLTLEFQLGSPVQQAPASGGSVTLGSGTAVIP
jgi:hypothetical protein